MHYIIGDSRKGAYRDHLNTVNSISAVVSVILTIIILLGATAVYSQSTPVTTGYRDFDFGNGVLDTPTGEKPESKIWFNDGFWWGSLWSPSANSYTIHKFNVGSQSWASTGTAIDDRGQSKADALWTGTKLYFVSHIYSTTPGPASSGQEARLYRYSYSAGVFTLDAGFPVNVNSSVSETLVLDRDSTGQLWITWTESGKVKINRSTTDDLTWGTPFDLPGQGTNIDPDDISSVVAFGGNKIGVMWSNRNDQKAYFAVHLNSDADLTWQAPEQALADAVLGNVADDHLNLKMTTDGSGNLYGVGKTRLSASGSPHIYVLQRTSAGVWSKHLVGKVKDGHTRPIIAIDDENGKIYIFTMSDVTGDDVIYMKSSSFPDPVFAEGVGTPFIKSATETHISNPSSTKQPLDSNTGILVIASDQNTHDYFHNYLDLSSSGDPSVDFFTPSNGTMGAEVTISGSNFTGATSVNFNGITAGAFTLVSEDEIRVTVPDDATTGKITVTTVGGEAISSNNFSVIPTVTSFTPTTGFVATEVTITGNNFGDASDVKFNGVSSSGFTIDSENQIRANVPAGATTGTISVVSLGGTTQSASDFTVITSNTTIFNPTHDTWVRLTTPTSTTNGSSVTLRARVTTTPDTLKSYLKFDVTGLSGSILSAVLRLNVDGGSSDGGSLYLVSNNLLDTSTPWTENATNWNNAPLISGTALGSAGAVDVGQWVEFDVISVITGDGTFSFGLQNNSSNDVLYHSKETATTTLRPELVIQTSGGGGPAAPTITSFTPTSGVVGSVVTITGTSLTGASDVKFNTTSATTFTVNSATQITATVPTGATTGKISVTTAGGTAQSSNDFTVTVPTTPTITSFTPTSGIAGSLVTITGTNFTGASDVKFNATSAIAFTVNSATQITATVPAGATTGKISVTTGGGTGQSATNFTVTVPPAPTITSFTPTSGPVGAQVTITGTNLSGATDVKFNTTSATTFTVNSATQITATVPTGATTGKISVTTSSGTGLSGPNFTVTLPSSPSTVTSFTPTSGPMTTEVTITGANFTGVTTVLFNTTAASSFTVDSDTQLRATVPSGATTGKISVTNGAGTGQSAADFTVTAPPPAPTITLFNPTSGGVGTEVTITGTDFAGATSVKFNGTSAFLYTVDSATQIRANVPSGASTGLISVTTAGGTGQSATNFTVTGSGSDSFTFVAAHDSYVKQSEGSAPGHGDEVELRVRKPSGDDIRSFLKFDISGLTGSVSSAKVRLYVVEESTSGGEMYSVSNEVLSGGTPWTESTLTWSNAPAIAGSPLSTAGAVALGEIVEFTVTSAIIGNGTYSFGVKTNSSNDVYYASRQDPFNPIPQLVIETIATPPPTISSFTPSSGMIGSQVTLTGTNFTVNSVVKFNGITATTVTVNSTTQITPTVPADATTGKISVTNEGGIAQSATDFAVGPVVSSFNPASGPEGSDVTITGRNFTGATSVKFNSLAAATLTMDSATQIRATVPTGATNGLISVTTPVGTGSSASSFTLTPSITSFTPTSGPVGTQVTITGANFTGASSVKFNGISASTFTVDSGTQIRATVPAGSTTGKISMTTPTGTAISANDFGVNPPIVTSFSPASGVVSAEVTITGSNFTGATNVTFNGASGFLTVDSPTQLRAIVPAAATSGKIGVTTGAGTAFSVNNFLVTPVVTSFTPATGSVGTEVTITSSGLNGTSSVQFNGTAAASFTLDSPTQVRAIVASGASSGKIGVTTAGGTALSPTDFLLSPEILSFTPASGLVGAQVTFTGVNFTGASSVKFNGTSAATFTVNSNTQIVATVPGEATTGKISVTSSIGAGLSTNNFVVTPAIASFTPASGVAGTEVTITGSGFTGASSVQFNGVAASTFTVDAHSQIRVNVPVGASTGKISVTTAGGVAVSANDFTLPGPSIASFTPSSGAVGVEVTVTGTNFTGANSVRFNGFSALTFTVDSNTQIRVTVPLGASTGKLTVVTLGGTALSANDFLVIPVISSFTPANGVAGTEVTITGSSFSGATVVQFNGTSASTFTVNSSTEIRAIVPASATTGKISLTTPGGTAQSATDFVVSAPSITSFTPASGLTGTEVTITGSNFVGVSNVTFNGISASTVTVDSPTQTRAIAPAGVTTGKISITTPGGTALSAANFTVSTPSIASFTPASGMVGAQVTITGSNFIGTTGVQFNGTAATTFTLDSNSQLRATVPSGATTGKISVVTGGGTALSANDFTVGPVITSFTPTFGAASTQVTITGLNFTGATAVNFNNTTAAFVVNSSTQISAFVPAGATNGKISVTTAAGTAISAADFTVSGPAISSFSPASGLVGTQITITGGSLSGASSVKFNGTEASTFIVDSQTQIRANVPAGATTGKITVTTSGGTALSTNDFKVTPAITSFTPTTGVAGIEVTITGNSFTGADSVHFNGVPAGTFTIDSYTQIRVNVPASATSGKIRVTTEGGSTLSATNFVIPAPSISSFTPTSGMVGAEVTITGNNFTSATSVQFNGTSVVTFTVDSNTLIRANVPSGAATGKISVITFGGTSLSANDFTVGPIISSFTPSSGVVGVEVTITGKNFTGATSVKFNNVSALFATDTATQIRATVPAGATTGKVSVTNSIGTAESVNDFLITPSISSFTPASGVAGIEVTITGNNLADASAVKFNNVLAAFIVNSPTQLRANVPAGVASGKISVITAGGTALSATDFSLLPPSISSFTPASGLVGVQVTISGNNLSGASSVQFNGIAATSFTVNSNSQIHATVPAGAATGKISVTTGGGTVLSAANFTVIAPAPSITSFTPPIGVIGAEVTVTGAEFTGASSVQFNGVAASSFTVNSNTQIRATVPAVATTGKISVTTGGGTAMSAGDFTVTSGSTATVTSLPLYDAYVRLGTPTTNFGNVTSMRLRQSGGDKLNSYLKFDVTGVAGPIISAKLRLQVTEASVSGGSAYSVSNNYNGTSTPWVQADINWNNAPAISGSPLSSLSAVSLGDLVEFDVTTAVTGNGIISFGMATTSSDMAQYSTQEGVMKPELVIEYGTGSLPSPTVSSFSPTSGAIGTQVTITGTNFTGVADVKFNTTSASTFTVDSATQIRANVPTGATTGKVSVTTGGGTAISATNFTVTAPPAAPTITSFTPSSGAVGAQITITGTNFASVTSVKFNITLATSFTVDSATQIRATVPTGATTGKISVTTAGGTATSVADFTVTAPPAAPTITSFTPSSGAVGAQITITGTNLTGATDVKFNTTSATSFTVDSATQIRATVPTGATTGKVSVTTTGGTATSVADFTVTTPPASPTIISFTPSSGAIGAQITITGTNFTGATDVKFNTTSATSFTVDSATQIRATVPTGATTGKVSVTTGGGTALSVTDFTVTSGSTATVGSFVLYDAYVRLGTPTANFGSVTSMRLRQSSGDKLSSYLKFDITDVTGSVTNVKLRLKVTEASVAGGSVYTVSNNYDGTSTPWVQSGITWNNAPPISGSSLSSLSAVNLGDVVEFDVTAAITGNGIISFGLATSSSDMAQYSTQEGVMKPELVIEYSSGPPAAPTISSFTPVSGPVGTPVTISGTNFSGATNVKFNGVSASTFTVNSTTQILATVPTGATTGKVSVTTSGGTATSAANYTVTAPPPSPTIASFTPTSGAAGIEVTIIGTNFTGATGVQFNGVAASSFTVDSNTQIRANLPSGATTGKIAVTTPGGTAQSTNDFTVTGSGTTTLTFTPFEDSYVQLSTPTTSYGSSSGLRARKTSSEQQKSYLKFSPSGITGAIVSATLRLKVTNASNDGGSAYKVSNNYLGTSTSWNESGINWNNAPAISGSPLSSVGAVSVGNVAEFDVASAITGTGNGTLSLAITNNSSDDVQFNSHEGAVDPELVIEFSSPSLARRDDGMVDEPADALPKEFSLGQNYPNPFNAGTTIEYGLPEAAQVRLAVYNSLGQLVRKLVDEMQSAGYKKTAWDGRDEHGKAVGTGMYFYRLDAGSRRLNGRMILQQ